MKINYNFLYGYCLNCFVSSRLVMRIIWCWCKWCKMIILSLFFNCYEMTSKSNENISATQKNCLSFWFQYTYSRIVNLFLNVSNVCSGYIMWKYEQLLLFLIKSSSSRFAMETNQFIIRHYRLFFHYFLTMFWWHQVLRALIHANNKWEKYILFFIYLFFTKLFGYDGGITSTKFLWQL